MSYTIMPVMPISMASGLKKSPNFNTLRQKTGVGITSALALQPYPTWGFEFSMDSIVGSERKGAVSRFIGTYMATQAGANLFLFTDPQDNKVTGGQFGTGDGSTTAFQLSRNIYGSVDIIQNLNGTPLIYVNNSLTTPASISNTGVVTFTTAPANNAKLTWSGAFYFLCRFEEDTIDSTRTFTINDGSDHWQFSGIKFTSEFTFTTSFGKIAANGGA